MEKRSYTFAKFIFDRLIFAKYIFIGVQGKKFYVVGLDFSLRAILRRGTGVKSPRPPNPEKVS